MRNWRAYRRFAVFVAALVAAFCFMQYLASSHSPTSALVADGTLVVIILCIVAAWWGSSFRTNASPYLPNGVFHLLAAVRQRDTMLVLVLPYANFGAETARAFRIPIHDITFIDHGSGTSITCRRLNGEVYIRMHRDAIKWSPGNSANLHHAPSDPPAA